MRPKAEQWTSPSLLFLFSWHTQLSIVKNILTSLKEYCWEDPRRMAKSNFLKATRIHMHHPSMDQAACQFSLLSYSCTRASFLPSLRHTRTLPTSWLLLLLKFQLPHNCTHPHNLPYHQFSFWQFCHGPPALSVSWLNFSRSFFNIRHTHDTGRSTARVVWDCGLPLSLQEGQRKGPFFLPRTAMAMRAPHSQSHCPPSYGAALFTHYACVLRCSVVSDSLWPHGL